MSLFFKVLTSPNRTEITKLVPNNNTSTISLYMLFAMTSKVWKNRKNFKINRKGRSFKKNLLKSGRSSALSEDLAGRHQTIPSHAHLKRLLLFLVHWVYPRERGDKLHSLERFLAQLVDASLRQHLLTHGHHVTRRVTVGDLGQRADVEAVRYLTFVLHNEAPPQH